jgi:uncharacterized phage protein (TIGR01671 family)
MNERHTFRGKREDNGEWAYGYYFADWRYNDNGNHYIRWADSSITVEVIPETVGQCTGLRDKNDNLIFEGDILKITYEQETYVDEEWGKRIITEILYVGWSGCAGFALKPEKEGFFKPFIYYLGFRTVGEINTDNWSVFEVIGNIHDNPELFSGGKP